MNMSKPDLRKTLLEAGLNPDSCAVFLREDLIQCQSNYTYIKPMLDEDSRIRHEILLLQRELLFRAITSL